ncbi:hypothetical protein SXCC_00612 [Gluconacetobacter sp. SXCC-1]|nr:hypothetical protein SXCC_00612 [Gluconacetobacter sp. SXCC-1]
MVIGEGWAGACGEAGAPFAGDGAADGTAAVPAAWDTPVRAAEKRKAQATVLNCISTPLNGQPDRHPASVMILMECRLENDIFRYLQIQFDIECSNKIILSTLG